MIALISVLFLKIDFRARAYIELAKLEENLYNQGILQEKGNLIPVLRRNAVGTGRWRKWMVGEVADYSVEKVLEDEELTGVITDVSGHYTFESPEVAAELKAMLDRLENVNVPARRYVIDKIKRSIGKYVSAYNLRGLTSKLRAIAD